MKINKLAKYTFLISTIAAFSIPSAVLITGCSCASTPQPEPEPTPEYPSELNIETHFTTDNYYDGAYYYDINTPADYSIGYLQQTIENDINGYQFDTDSTKPDYTFGSPCVTFRFIMKPTEDGEGNVFLDVIPTVGWSYGGGNSQWLHAISKDPSSTVASNSIEIKVYTGPIQNHVFYRLVSSTNEYEALNVDGNISGEVAIQGMFEYTNPSTEESITIKTTAIAENGFKDCSNITSINLGIEVATINSYAFANCSNLSNVHLSNTLQVINSHAFENCSSITHITFDSKLISIGEYAFNQCTNLSSVTFLNSDTSWLSAVAENAFDGCNIKSIAVPAESETAYKEALKDIPWAASAVITAD